VPKSQDVPTVLTVSPEAGAVLKLLAPKVRVLGSEQPPCVATVGCRVGRRVGLGVGPVGARVGEGVGTPLQPGSWKGAILVRHAA
jgi:hypothetical protein